MSLLSRLRQDVAAAERTAQQTTKESVKRRGRELKRKAKRDVRAAERAASRKKAELKRQARQDIRRAREDGASNAAAAAKQAAKAAASGARSLDVTDSPGVESPETTAEIFGRAGDAATVRSPMNATLDPGASGPALEQFATANPTGPQPLATSGVGGGRDAPDDGEALLGEGFIAGGGVATDERDDVAPLALLGTGGDDDDDEPEVLL